MLKRVSVLAGSAVSQIRTLSILPLFHHAEEDLSLDAEKPLMDSMASSSPLRTFDFDSLNVDDYDVQPRLPFGTQHTVDKILKIVANRKWGPDVVHDLNQLQVRINTYQVASVLKFMEDSVAALEFFQWASEQDGFRHNLYTYNRLFDILSEAKDFRTIEAMIQDMFNFRIEMKPHIFTAAAKAYIASGMYDSAMRVFLGMQKFECKPDAQAFNVVIDAFMRAGQPEEAHNLYSRMVNCGYFPSLHICNILMDSFWRADMAADATGLFEKMKEKGEYPNIITYNALVKVYAKKYDAQSLAYVIREMEEKGSKPNLSTYNTVIGALVQAGNADVAVHFFNHMVGLDLFPNNFTYAQLIDGLGGSGRLQDAQNLFRQAKSMGGTPDSYVYNALVINLSRGEKWNSAWQLVGEMRGNGLKPSRAAYIILLDAMKKAKKLDHCRRALDSMVNDGYVPHLMAYHDLIGLYFAKRESDKAFEVLNDMKRTHTPDLGTYNLLLKLCNSAKDVQKCEQVFISIRKAGIEPSIISYSTLIHSLGQKGKVKEACSLFREMKRKGCAPDVVAYNNLLKAMIQVGQVKKAMPVFEEAKRKFPNDLIMYSIMIDGFGRTRQFGKAMGLLKEMKSKGIQPDHAIFHSLIVSYFKDHDPEEAYDLFTNMKKYGCEPTRRIKDMVNFYMRRSATKKG